MKRSTAYRRTVCLEKKSNGVKTFSVQEHPIFIAEVGIEEKKVETKKKV